MPFYTIDWTRYVNHADSRGSTVDASSTINDIMRIPMKIWKCSGIWFGYKLSKKFRWINLVHRFLLAVCILCISAASVFSFKYWRPLRLDAVTVTRMTLTLIYWQCCACAISIFYWQFRKRFKTFGKLMNAATMGIGLMREKEHLRKAQYPILIGFGFWAFVFSLYHVLGLYLPQQYLTVPFPWKQFFWKDNLQPISLCMTISGAFQWFMAHVLLVDYYAFLAAEMHSLNADLKADSNLYQVAVLKHYTLIYHRLCHVNRNFNASFGPLLTMITMANYLVVVLQSILLYTSFDRMDVAELVLATVSLTMAASYLIAFVIAALELRNKGEYFYHVVQDVVAMDWNLDAEYHPVAACNAIYAKPLTFGLAFGTSHTVTARRLAKILIFTIIIIVLLLFRIP